MADIEFGETVGGGDPGYTVDVKTIINGFGALVSLSLIAGLGWWGYQLMVRDVTGVPVVRALEGPMRVAPEDPGGSSAQYQGLAVNNIPAVGEAEAPADRLVLAPKPTSLTPEDQPAEVLGAIAAAKDAEKPAEAAGVAVASAPDEPQAAPTPTPTPTPAPAPADPALDRASVIEATLKSLAGGAPVSGDGAGPGSEAISAEIPGVSRSLLPLPRPAAIAAREQADAPAQTAALTRGEAAPVPASVPAAVPAAVPAPRAPAGSTGDGVASIDPADIPAGTRLVQLGAFETPEVARAEWRKVADRFADLMADKARVIEKAQAGGRVFYRLRAHGFKDMSDARRFCSALVLKDADCIPVVTR